MILETTRQPFEAAGKLEAAAYERTRTMYKAPEIFNGQDLEASPFDTPEAKASTAFVAAQSIAMAARIEADKQQVCLNDSEPNLVAFNACQST